MPHPRTQTLRANSADDALVDVVNALKGGLGDDLVAIVLYGSRARREASDLSDWDLLVLARHLPYRELQRHLFMKGLLPEGWRGRVAVLAKTVEEFEAHLPALFLDIALDGVILFDTGSYTRDRLRFLKGLIRRRGLRREHTADGAVWRWERFPGFDWSLQWEIAQ